MFEVVNADGEPVEGVTGSVAVNDDGSIRTVLVRAPGYATKKLTNVDRDDVRSELAPGFRVAGTIVDSAGKPVARARISSDPLANAETGNDGRFVLEGASTGLRELFVTHPDYVNKKEWVEAGDESIRITLYRPGTISGRILMPDGTPAEFASYDVNESHDRLQRRRLNSYSGSYFFFLPPTTDATGVYRHEQLPPGPCRLSADLDDHEARLEVMLKEGEHRKGVVLRLERSPPPSRRAFVRLSVVDQNGERTSAAVISVDGGERTYKDWFLTDCAPGERVRVAVGVYGQVTEFHAIAAADPDEAPEHLFRVFVPERPPEPKQPDRGRVRGRVVAPAGASLEDYELELEQLSGDPEPPRYIGALPAPVFPWFRAGPGGGFEIRRPVGRWVLSARRRSITEARLEFMVRKGRVIDLGAVQLRPPRTVTGRVVDERGMPVGGARIRAEGRGTSSHADGTFRLKVSTARTMSLTVTKKGYGTTPAAVDAGEIMLHPPGRLEVRIEPEGGLGWLLVKVVWPGHDGRPELGLYSTEETVCTTELSPGRVLVAGPEGKEREAVISAGKTTVVDFR